MPAGKTMRGAMILGHSARRRIYPEPVVSRISEHVEWVSEPLSAAEAREKLAALRDAEVIFSGWQGLELTGEVLQALPELKLVLYGAGSLRGIVTEAFWKRGITICSAVAANAVPVAEYVLSQILFGLKRGWAHAARCKRGGRELLPMPGAFGSTVGLVSLGTVGRLVCRLLRAFDIRVIAYDPFVAEAEAAGLGVTPRTLEEVFRESEVVSLHIPDLPETKGMITGRHIESMRPNAVLVNTARGSVVREAEMCEALASRSDVWAVLDVTHPEPPEPDSPLYRLPNVVLTPHIAGSMDGECARMGLYMAEELERFVAGKPLKWTVDEKRFRVMA